MEESDWKWKKQFKDMNNVLLTECEDDLVEEIMRESAMMKNASDGDILKMFFEELNDKCADMDGGACFKQLFEVALPSHFSIEN